MAESLKVLTYEERPSLAFGPLSDYRVLVGEDCPDVPVRTGIQTARAGYAAKLHWHPYVEILHILQGEAAVWERGHEQQTRILRPGDTLVIPARAWHAFRVHGEQPLRLLGTHLSSERIVYYEDGTSSFGATRATELSGPR